MKAMVIPVLGHPVVVDGDWDEPGVIETVLDCEKYRAVELPHVTGPVLHLLYDEAGAQLERDVNPLATELVGDRFRRGEYVAGPALVVGFDHTGASVELNLLDLVRLGARLVRAERAALQ